MRNIIDKMNSLYPISDETIQILKENTVLCHFPKRHQLIEADKFCKSAYFIEEGMTRSFWLVNGEEKKFIGSFYAYGICGVVIQWVTDGMKEQTDEVAQRLRRLARSTELLASRRFAEIKNESSEP